MASTLPLDSNDPRIVRAARALRGRFGVDVWERFVNADRRAQANFLARNGIADVNVLFTRTCAGFHQHPDHGVVV